MTNHHNGIPFHQQTTPDTATIIELLREDAEHRFKHSTKRNDSPRKVRHRFWISGIDRKFKESTYRQSTKRQVDLACRDLMDDVVISDLAKCQPWAWYY